MDKGIIVTHKTVRVDMKAAGQARGKLRVGGGARPKSLAALGYGGECLEFKRKGPEGLSPQPINTFGHSRQTILGAYVKAREALQQYVWEAR